MWVAANDEQQPLHNTNDCINKDAPVNFDMPIHGMTKKIKISAPSCKVQKKIHCLEFVANSSNISSDFCCKFDI